MRHHAGWLIALGALAAVGCGPAGPDEGQLLEKVKTGDVKMVIEYLKPCSAPKTDLCAFGQEAKDTRCAAVAEFIVSMREKDLAAAGKSGDALAAFRADQRKLIDVFQGCPDGVRTKVLDTLRGMESMAAK